MAFYVWYAAFADSWLKWSCIAAYKRKVYLSVP